MSKATAQSPVIFPGTESQEGATQPPAQLRPNQAVPPVVVPTREPNFPISYVTVVIGTKTRDGSVEEQVHTIEAAKDLRISDYQFGIRQKHKMVKNEEGETLGFEPTGEETLKLTLSYIREA